MNNDILFVTEKFYNANKCLRNTVDYNEKVLEILQQMSTYVNSVVDSGYQLESYASVCKTTANVYESLVKYYNDLVDLGNKVAEMDPMIAVSLNYLSGGISDTEYNYARAQLGDIKYSELLDYLKQRATFLDGESSRLSKSYYEIVASLNQLNPSSYAGPFNNINDARRNMVEQQKRISFEIAKIKSELELIEEMKSSVERAMAKEKWDSIFDWNDNGVAGYREFAQGMKNYDYGTGIVGYTSDGIFAISGESLDMFADYVMAPLINMVGDVAYGSGEVAIDYVFDYKENPINANLKLRDTVLNLGVSLTEGVVDFAETGVDAVITGGSYLIYASLLDGSEDIAVDFMNTAAEVISFEASSYLYDKLYSWQPVSDLNDNAFSAAQRGEVLYNGTKAVGYYVPILVATNYLNASSAITMPKHAIQANIVAFSSYGKYSEKYFGTALKNAGGYDLTDREIAEVFLKTGVSTAIDAGTVYLAGEAKNLVDNSTLKNYISGTSANIGVKALKPIINETTMHFAFEDDFSWDDVIVDTAAVIVAENMAESFGKAAPKITSSTTEGMSMLQNAGVGGDASVVVDMKKMFNDLTKDLFKRVGKEESSSVFKEAYAID